MLDSGDGVSSMGRDELACEDMEVRGDGLEGIMIEERVSRL
jgi:hypothetical protein